LVNNPNSFLFLERFCLKAESFFILSKIQTENGKLISVVNVYLYGLKFQQFLPTSLIQPKATEFEIFRDGTCSVPDLLILEESCSQQNASKCCLWIISLGIN